MVEPDQIERAFLELDKVSGNLWLLGETSKGELKRMAEDDAQMIGCCIGILKKALEEKKS